MSEDWKKGGKMSFLKSKEVRDYLTPKDTTEAMRDPEKWLRKLIRQAYPGSGGKGRFIQHLLVTRDFNQRSWAKRRRAA